jgi:glutamate dehydrogenase/leucine dehydrogenase
MPPAQRECLFAPVTSFQIPSNFSWYFSRTDEQLQVKQHADLLPHLPMELSARMKSFEIYELKPTDGMSHHMVFMEDIDGERALMIVAQDTRIPENRHPFYGDLAIIGGTGIYETPKGRSPAEYALSHAHALGLAMRNKTAMAGLRKTFGLSGMKATIATFPGQKKSDWEKSVALQEATGWLYGPLVFKQAMTGTDARQTPKTIAAMARGSALANPDDISVQICGTRRNFDTPGACEHSLEATIDALNRHYPNMPKIKGSVISIQGYGRIGQAAVELALRREANRILISDIRLLVPNNGMDQKQDRELWEKIYRLQEEYPPGKITIVDADAIYTQKADIFMPCASTEGLLTEVTLDQLHQAGVKAIIAGANKILDPENIWELAKRAHDMGIIMPPEILTNCGSVTMAGMEALYAHLRTNAPEYQEIPDDSEAERIFVAKQVIPFIRKNAEKMIETLRNISTEDKTDLYTAGIVWCRKQFSPRS